MKNPGITFVLLLAAAGVGFGASYMHAKKQQESLNQEIAKLTAGTKLVADKQLKAEALAEQRQTEVEMAFAKLDETQKVLLQAKKDLARVTEERDTYKRTLDAARNPSGQTTKKPTGSDSIKPGTLDLPQGFSKGGREIKRPGE